MAELPLSVEERLARLEGKVNAAWVNGIDLLASEGYIGLGKPATLQLTNDGIKIISATSPLDDAEKERYIEWVSKTIWGAVVGRLGVAYAGGIVTTQGTWLVELATDAQMEIGTASNIDTETPSKRVTVLISDFVDAGSTSGLFVQARSTSSATQRDILSAEPHVTGGSGRVKVGYDAADTDDIIALVLDNADTTADLPTAAARLRGGLALVEGSPDKLYVCRSPDGGSSYEWVVLGGGVVELVVKGSDQSNSTTTLQDASDMSFAIAANTEVWMKAELYFLDNGGGDVKWDFTVPSGCSGSYWYQTFGASSDELAENSIADTEAISMVTDQTMRVTMHGLINNGANEGTIKLRFACNGASAGNTALQSGSYIQWQVQ